MAPPVVFFFLGPFVVYLHCREDFFLFFSPSDWVFAPCDRKFNEHKRFVSDIWMSGFFSLQNR